MAFAARRSLASGLSRHIARRLHPSLSHLVPSRHDRSEGPSSSSSAPPNPTHKPSPLPSGDLRGRRSRSQNLTLPLPFGAHRNFSSAPEVLSDAASSVGPAPFPGEVAAAAADSFLPVAAVQHLIDAVHSFTGLNWWASIALAMVFVRTATLPFVLQQFKEQIRFKALRPEVKAIDKDLNSTDQERKMKLSELYRKYGVSRLTPYKLIFIQMPVLLSFTYAIRNMIEKVPSLEGGGAYWFTDLTTPDQLYILPVLTSIAYAAQEINIKACLDQEKPKNFDKNFNRVFSVLIIPVSMSFCKAHFFYWVPWTLFNIASVFAFRQPALMQYLDIPQVAPPRPAPAAPAPASEGPKPIPSVDSPPAAPDGCGQSSSEPVEKSVSVEKKRRTPRVITIRLQ